MPQRCLKYWRSYEGPKVQRSFIVREVADRLCIVLGRFGRCGLSTWSCRVGSAHKRGPCETAWKKPFSIFVANQVIASLLVMMMPAIGKGGWAVHCRIPQASKATCHLAAAGRCGRCSCCAAREGARHARFRAQCHLGSCRVGSGS